MASHGNRCARLRGRSARRAPRSSAARAARWSSRRCPSSKVLLCPPSTPLSPLPPPARPGPPATGAGALGRPGLPLVTPLCLPRAALSPPVLPRPLPPHPLPFSRVLPPRPLLSRQGLWQEEFGDSVFGFLCPGKRVSCKVGSRLLPRGLAPLTRHPSSG